MKRLLSVLLTAAMLLALFAITPLSASAGGDRDPNGQFGDFAYYDDGDEVGIAKYTGDSPNVTIPSEIDGKKVTYIGTYAF